MPDADPNGVGRLAEKVAKVMQDIESVPKNGWNSYHEYEYSTDDDVMQAVRPVMAEHNLIALPSIVDRDTEVRETSSGTTLHTDITLEITLIDGDSGQSKTMRWRGEAQDGQDKGLYKAMTSAIKYWALKTFLLSADADVETHDAAADQPQSQNRSSSQPQKGEKTEHMTDVAVPGEFWDSYDKDKGENLGDADFSILEDELRDNDISPPQDAEVGVTKNGADEWRITIESQAGNGQSSADAPADVSGLVDVVNEIVPNSHRSTAMQAGKAMDDSDTQTFIAAIKDADNDNVIRDIVDQEAERVL